MKGLTMLTPEYGDIKQEEYRNRIEREVKRWYNYKFIRILSLAGAHCFENSESIENMLLKRNRRRELHIVESKPINIRKILQSLTDVVGERHNSRIMLWHGTYKGSTVYVAQCTMNRYLRHCAENGIALDVIIADYFDSINGKVIKDLNIMFENKLINRFGHLFLTAADSSRIKTQPCYERIMGYAHGDNYAVAARNYVKYKAISKGINPMQLNRFDYKERGQGKTRMCVVHLQVSY